MADEVKYDEHVIKSKEGASPSPSREELIVVKSMEGALPHNREMPDSIKEEEEEEDQKHERSVEDCEESNPVQMEHLHVSGLKETCEDKTYVTIEIKHDDVPTEDGGTNDKVAAPPHPAGDCATTTLEGRKGKKGFLNKIKERIPGLLKDS